MQLKDLSESELKAVERFASHVDLNIMKMSVGDVVRCIISPESFEEYIEEQKMSVFEKIGFIKAFITQANNVFKSFDEYNTDIPIEYTVVANSVKGLSTAEGIITDCIHFYNLHSTEEAERLPFGDWYLMKREQCVTQTIQRKYDKMIADKQLKNPQKRL